MTSQLPEKLVRNHVLQSPLFLLRGLEHFYRIHVPGWMLKWLNLITAHGSVSNELGSVTWIATKYLKTVSWRNHTEELTTLWPQNISYWPKINIPSSNFTILMLNTLKLQLHSYVTAVKFLTYRQVSNIRGTLVGNYIVDHSDVVGASPVGAAPTTSSFST